MATRKIAQIPNFTPTNDQIYVRDPSTDVPNSPDDPDMILIFGWGDGLPKHVSKYAEGYATLYPAARQIIILGPISKFFFASLARRVTDMAPVVEALKDLVNPTATKESKIMIQAMSNSGGSNYASMLQAYRDKYAKPLPHQLVIFDSTPGNPEWSWGRMLQWSRAMSMGMAKYFPWPEFFTRGLMSITIMVMYLIGFLTRQEPAGVFAARVMDDPSYLSTETKKLYLYSKEDDMISHKDIEMYEARARTKGYQTEAVLFDGSPHVGHMRQHPEKYWGSIQKAWLNAIQKQ